MTQGGRGQGHVSYFWSNGTDTRVPQNVFLVIIIIIIIIITLGKYNSERVYKL